LFTEKTQGRKRRRSVGRRGQRKGAESYSPGKRDPPSVYLKKGKRESSRSGGKERKRNREFGKLWKKWEWLLPTKKKEKQMFLQAPRREKVTTVYGGKRRNKTEGRKRRVTEKKNPGKSSRKGLLIPEGERKGKNEAEGRCSKRVPQQHA